MIRDACQGRRKTPDDGRGRHDLRAREAVAQPAEQRREDGEGEQERGLHVADLRIGQAQPRVFLHVGGN